MTTSLRSLGATPPIIRGCVVFLLTAIVLGGSACSKLRNEHSSAGEEGGSVANNSNTRQPSPPGPPSAVAEGTPTTWEARASSLNGSDGRTFTLACSPGGTEHTVWGSDIYTADSSICTAAVHSGLITYQRGGVVTIEVRPGRPIYGCSEKNGVTTSCYGAYTQSFIFKTPNNEPVVPDTGDQTSITWNISPALVSFEAGKTLKFKCPPGGTESSVWGTDIYTADSSICNAAVHAGKFTRESGGAVTIELRPGESSYRGTTRNGVKTNDYEKYGESFVVK